MLICAIEIFNIIIIVTLALIIMIVGNLQRVGVVFQRLFMRGGLVPRVFSLDLGTRHDICKNLDFYWL